MIRAALLLIITCLWATPSNSEAVFQLEQSTEWGSYRLTLLNRPIFSLRKKRHVGSIDPVSSTVTFPTYTKQPGDKLRVWPMGTYQYMTIPDEPLP